MPSSRLADITLPGHAYWRVRERDDRVAQEIPTVVEKPASGADTGQLLFDESQFSSHLTTGDDSSDPAEKIFCLIEIIDRAGLPTQNGRANSK